MAFSQEPPGKRQRLQDSSFGVNSWPGGNGLNHLIAGVYIPIIRISLLKVG